MMERTESNQEEKTIMIRYGIIGAGRMGNAHASQTRQIEGTAVTGVYDINPDAAQKMHTDYGAAIHRSPEELASAPDVDCVIVTSPTYCHQEGVLAAVAAHKPIFCEKALCRTQETEKELLNLLKNYDQLFTVGFVRRHLAKSILIKRMVEEGAIGTIRYCNVDLPLGKYQRMPGDWFSDFDLCGGVIIDMLAHHIDLANWYFGAAKRVYADSLLLSKEQPMPADYAAAVVTYENGVICNMMCSWQRFGRTNELMEIYGDKGALLMDGSNNITHISADGNTTLIDSEKEWKKEKCTAQLEEVNIGSGLFCQLKNITDTLNGKPHPLPTIQDACNSLDISFAMINSVKNGKAILLES